MKRDFFPLSFTAGFNGQQRRIFDALFNDDISDRVVNVKESPAVKGEKERNKIQERKRGREKKR